jgi:hypothetical protein
MGFRPGFAHLLRSANLTAELTLFFKVAIVGDPNFTDPKSKPPSAGYYGGGIDRNGD